MILFSSIIFFAATLGCPLAYESFAPAATAATGVATASTLAGSAFFDSFLAGAFAEVSIDATTEPTAIVSPSLANVFKTPSASATKVSVALSESISAISSSFST